MGTDTVLAIDVGSSSVKAALVRGGRIVGRVTRADFPTRRVGATAEVDAVIIERAIGDAIRQLGKGAKGADRIALATMSPAWALLDRRGRAITPVITHQDRRSEEEARRLADEIGRARYLKLAGNLPIPGGMSVTSWLWFRRHHPSIIRKAAVYAHLGTLMIHALTGRAVIDPSNASFTGLYDVPGLGGWREELLDAARVPRGIMPEVQDADRVAGEIMRPAAERFGLKAGTPVLSGLVDTSAAFYLTDLKPGRAVNSSGSTDVLAVLADHPRPSPLLLTRGLGTGRRWLSVATLAAAGSAMQWARQTFFSEMSERRFYSLLDRIDLDGAGSARFLPLLAGSRTEIEQRTAELTGLTLGTTREQILAAVVDGLAEASAARIALLEKINGRMGREILMTGGGRALFHRKWPKRLRFRQERDAILRGLGSV